MVSIAAFQAVDPGSIPGRRNFFFFLRYHYWELNPGEQDQYRVYDLVNTFFIIGYQRFYGVMVSTQDSESCDPSSNLGRT